MKTKTSSGKKFAPKKSLIFLLTYFLINFAAIILILLFWKPRTLDVINIVSIGAWLLFLGYYFWQWTGTYYELRNGQLFYRSGFTKGHIPVSSIRKIETHTRSWASTNAAISNKGMMITYNKWDELFIAPKDEAGFLATLLQINPDIQIKSPDQLVSY